MPLSDAAVRNLKIRDKLYKVADSHGLYIEVQPRSRKHPYGAKVWRYRYRVDGKATKNVIGPFGDGPGQFSVAAARKRRDELRSQVGKGQKPHIEAAKGKREEQTKANNTFGLVAKAWADAKKKKKLSPDYPKRLDRFVRVTKPLHASPIEDIDRPMLLAFLETLSKTPAWAHGVRAHLGEVFAYAVVKNGLKKNPTLGLKEAARVANVAMKPEPVPNPFLKANEIPAFVAAIDAANPRLAITEKRMRQAIKLLMLTMLRPGEVTRSEWSMIDFDAALWSLPARIMKEGRPHTVPLSTQALALLRELKKQAGDSKYILPQLRAPLTRSGDVEQDQQIFHRFIWGIGYKGRVTAHGLRATAATMLNHAMEGKGDEERPMFSPLWVEVQLSHISKSSVAARYTHLDENSFLPQRRRMLQWYADQIMRKPAKVLPLRKAA